MKNMITTKDIILIGLFAAITAIMSQISIPLGFSPVPMTLQIFAVCLSGIILGSRLGSISQIVFILIGAVGMPVFANFSGGFHHIIGPTGGFIISFPIVAFISGKFTEKSSSIKMVLPGLFIALFICYVLGVLQLSLVTKMGITKAILVGVLPYIPLDIMKILIVAFSGLEIRKKLINANLILDR